MVFLFFEQLFMSFGTEDLYRQNLKLNVHVYMNVHKQELKSILNVIKRGHTIDNVSLI